MALPRGVADRALGQRPVLRSQLGAQGEKLSQQKPRAKSWRWEHSCGRREAGVAGKFQTPVHGEELSCHDSVWRTEGVGEDEESVEET